MWSHVTQPAGHAGERHRFSHARLVAADKSKLLRTPEKPQIIAALNDAGLSGAARDAEKMKKGDAAEHAEFHMKDNRWVPGWMCALRPQAETETTEYRDNQADAA